VATFQANVSRATRRSRALEPPPTAFALRLLLQRIDRSHLEIPESLKPQDWKAEKLTATLKRTEG
jgi:hypothetical protein